MQKQIWNKLCLAGSRLLNPKALFILCIAVLFVLFFPLVVMCFHAHPVYDDFSHTLDTARTWAQTGNILSVLQSAWQHMLHFYRTWQGTFVAMFLSVWQPMVFSPELFWITPLTTLLALGVSAYFCIKQLVCRLLCADKSTTLTLYTVLMFFMLAYMPGMREVLYWQSGTPYTLSVIALFVLVGMLLSLHCGAGQRLVRTAVSVLMGIIIGGCPYPLALGCTVGAFLIAFWCVWRHSPARSASILSFAAMLCSLIVVVAAPGNAIRQLRAGESLPVAETIVRSLETCAQLTGEWFSPQLIAVSLLLVFLSFRALQNSSLSFRNPGWFSFFSFGVLAASFAPPLYAQGVEGYQVDRILASLYMLYVVLIFLNILYWIGWASRRIPIVIAKLRVWQLALCAGLLFWGLLSCGILSTPFISSWTDLISGNATRYHSEMTAREEALRDAASSEEAARTISALSSHPVVLPPDKLIYQTDTNLPWQMHEYYRLAALTRQYGAGQIPEAEWAALEAELTQGVISP